MHNSISSGRKARERRYGGAILTSTLGVGGLGYAIGDIGRIDNGVGGRYVVDTVNGSGTILTYRILNAGSRYSVGLAQTTAVITGAGVGFTVNLATVSAPGSLTA